VFKEEYKTAIAEKKAYYTDRLTSRYRQLYELNTEKISEAERALVAAEAEKTKEAERLRLDNEAAARNSKAASEAETAKQVLTANTLFDVQGSVPVQEPAKVRESYNIVITHPAGYQLIVAKYFEKEGLAQPIDALEKKTLGSMKLFCEKLMKDSGEKIVSPYLRYEKDFKAVNTK